MNYMTESIRRVAVIGSGPMGLSLTAYLLQKVPVVLVVRNPEHIAQLHAHGIQFKNNAMQVIRKPIIVSLIEELKEFSDIDLVFIATKSCALLNVCLALKNVVSKQAYIVSYQNGFNTGQEIIDYTDNKNVLRMVLFYGAMFDDQKRIEMVFNNPPHHIGCLLETQQKDCKKIAALLSESGLNTVFNPAIEEIIWEKSISNACVSPVCALTRTTIKQAMNSPARSLIINLLKEAVAVAEKHHIGVPINYFEKMVTYLDTLGDHYPSMVLDVLNNNPTEIVQLNAQIISLGNRYKISTIAHDAVFALIQAIDFQALFNSGDKTNKKSRE